MKCIKCAYEFGELKANYCPNCGKKLPKEVEDVSSLKNADFWCFARFEDFKKEWDELKTLDAEDAFAWLCDRHEVVPVYTIEATVMWNGKKQRYLRKCSEDDLYYGLIEKTPSFSLENVGVRQQALARSFSPNMCGKSWWWSKEECLKVIQKAQERAKRRIALD